MSSEARRIYDEAVVIDGLNVSNWESDAVFEGLRAGDVTAINATVATWENFSQTMAHLAVWMRRFRERDDILQVKETADIHAARRLGKTGIILGFQNASPIENELDRLGLFLALGVRVIQLTYHETNLLGSGCWERNDAGLSNFGVDAVREMNQLGILIDLSHVGPRTTLEAIETSEQPVAITHANARSFCGHPRNKEEEALTALAEKGGVVGATSFRQLPSQGVRLDAGGLRRRHRRHGGAHRHRPRRFRHRLHPRPAARVLALHRIAAGHEIPLDLCRWVGAVHRAEFPAARGWRPRWSSPTWPKRLPAGATAPTISASCLGGNWLRLFERVWNP